MRLLKSRNNKNKKHDVNSVFGQRAVVGRALIIPLGASPIIIIIIIIIIIQHIHSEAAQFQTQGDVPATVIELITLN